MRWIDSLSTIGQARKERVMFTYDDDNTNATVRTKANGEHDQTKKEEQASSSPP